MPMGDEAKARGNGKYTDGYAGAIRHLSYVFLQKYKVADANKSGKLKPDWSHGQYNDAVWAYKKGLEIFSPRTWARLTADPATRVYLQQPDFLKMMHDIIQKDSSNLNFYLKDPRVMQAFDVLLKGSPTNRPEPEGEGEGEAEAEASASGAMALEAGERISYLKVSSRSQLLELPSTLKSLTIIGCHYLESLQHVPINKCINLSELCIIDCCSLKYFADHGWYPSSLTSLSVLDCGKLEFLLTVKKMPNLEYLFLGNSCDSLKSFTLNLFPKLRFLTIRDCPNLQSFSNFMDGRHNNNNLSLESLTIRRCPNLVSFPTEGLLSPSLKSIWLSNCENLRSLPNYMTTLTSLQSLFIERCPELESLPAGGLPSSLTFLSIAFCDKLTPQKEWNLHSLRCLSHFKLHGGCIGLKSFPEKDLLPINLNSLYISELPDLWVLDHIGLQQLTALQSLEINCCQKLWLFPRPLPPSLTSLCIKASSKLTPKLLNQQSEDWRKIAHISRIQIDDSVISSNNTGRLDVRAAKKEKKMCRHLNN